MISERRRMEIVKSDENIVDVAEHVSFDLTIRSLDLSKNQISYLPDEVGNLLNIKVRLIFKLII